MALFKLNNIFGGRYLLIELLNEEASTEVWKAKDRLADDAFVVLKIHASGKGLEENVVDQLRKAFTLSNYFSHPHLLKIYHFDFSKQEDAAYLVLPFYHGGTLKSLRDKDHTFSEKQVARVLSQIGSALEELHRQEPPVLHRDVRPENILISRPDYFVLSGLTADSLTGSGATGPVTDSILKSSNNTSPDSRPPESRGEAPETEPSRDVYALGAVLFELCSGTRSGSLSEGNSPVKGERELKLPEHYSAGLKEVLMDCIREESTERPTAGELSLKGKHYLETGSWDLSENTVPDDNNKLKRVLPYLVAVAVLVFFIVSAFWEYQNNPLKTPKEKLRNMVSSGGQENKDVDAMLIEVLEQERNELAKRNTALERKNRQLMYFDSVNTVNLKSQANLILQLQGQPQPAAGGPEQPPAGSRVQKARTAQTKAVAASSAPAGGVNRIVLTEELEEQLNKISDPRISGQARADWKAETMAKFAEGAVRITDETDGTPKQYSPGIFLNLLYNVPHTIEVKEVKSDRNRKVTELRLTMQAKM